MASTRDKIEQTLQEIYGCISQEHREAVIRTALLKMAYKENSESNVLSSVMDAIDEIEVPDASPASPSYIKLEASSDLIGWDDIEQYLQEDHIDEFETRFAETEREREDRETRFLKKKDKGFYRQPDELQGKDESYSLQSEYKDNNREYDASARTYTDTSVDPTDASDEKKVVIGLDNRKLGEGNLQDDVLDVWPPRTRADIIQS